MQDLPARDTRPRPFNLNHFLFGLCVALWHRLLSWKNNVVQLLCRYLCKCVMCVCMPVSVHAHLRMHFFSRDSWRTSTKA